MTTYATDFRCYRRGRIPDDWTQLWNSANADFRVEGAASDLSHRNALRLSMATGAAAARAALTFNPIDDDANKANIEILALIRQTYISATNTPNIIVLRGSGAAGAENAYVASIDVGAQNAVIRKFVAGTATVLGTSATIAAIGMNAYLFCRFRANGTTVQVKVWAEADSEPGAWSVTVTDAAVATGAVGLMYNQPVALHYSEVPFCSFGTNGDTAPSPSTLPSALDQFCLLPDAELERTLEIEYFDGAATQKFWASDHGRNTAAADFPASTRMEPILSDAGGIGSGLSADTQFGGAALPNNLSSVVLGNTPIPPDAVGALAALGSVGGHQVVERIGRRWLTPPTSPGAPDGVLNPHRNFEILLAAATAQEPVIAGEVSLRLASVTKFLDSAVPVRRNIGIPHCLTSLTTLGTVSFPNKTNYDVKQWTLMFRLLVPTAGIAGAGTSVVAARSGGSPNRQFVVSLNQASSAAPHTLNFNVQDGTGNIINSTPTTQVNTAWWVNCILAVAGLSFGSRWYLYMDNVKVASGTLATDPVVATGATVGFPVSLGGGVSIDDLRWYNTFLAEEEALNIFASKAAPDARCILMARMDDNTGAVVTDYSSLANNGAIGGVVNTDYRWDPTYLGGPEVAGTSMPLAEGAIFHGPAVPVDSTRELFRHNDRAPLGSPTLTARAQGLSISTPAAWTNPGGGVIDIVGASSQPVTFATAAASPAAAAHQLPQLIRDVLVARGAIGATTADLDSFLSLRVQLPHVAGFAYPAPPTVSDLLGLLATVGGHYRLDGSGRVAVGAFQPPLLPLYVTFRSGYPVLELMGYPNRGVTVGFDSSYALNQNPASYSTVRIWMRALGSLTDSSVSSSFTHFPTGRTLVDFYDPVAAKGYYLGIDGRSGDLILGTPGLTAAGKHFLALPYATWSAIGATGWVLVTAGFANTARYLGVMGFNAPYNVGNLFVTDFPNAGAYAAPTGVPLRIGHGYGGSFAGGLAYAIGSNAGQNQFDTRGTNSLTHPAPNDAPWVDRWFVSMAEGEGDVTYEQILNRAGRINGARWAPRLLMDFTRPPVAGDSAPEFGGWRRANPAWRVDGRYQKNYAVISGADVAGGVSASDRVALQQPSLSLPQWSTTTEANYPLAQDISLDSPLATQAGMAAVSQAIYQRLYPGKILVDVNKWPRSAMRLLPTDEVLLTHPALGSSPSLNSVMPMRIYSLLAALQAMTVDAGLWGG